MLAVGEVCLHVPIAVADVVEPGGGGGAADEEAVELAVIAG